MQKDSKEWKKWTLWFIFAIVLVCLYKLLDNFGDITAWIKGFITILMPFIMALLVAYLFYLPCRKIEGIFLKSKSRIIKKKARSLSIFVVYFLAILLIVGIIKFVVPSVSESVVELVSALPDYYDTALEKINELPDESIITKESLISVSEDLNNIKIEDDLHLDNLAQYAKGLIGVATTIFDIFVTIIVSIFILAERTSILRYCRRL